MPRTPRDAANGLVVSTLMILIGALTRYGVALIAVGAAAAVFYTVTGLILWAKTQTPSGPGASPDK